MEIALVSLLALAAVVVTVVVMRAQARRKLAVARAEMATNQRSTRLSHDALVGVKWTW